MQILKGSQICREKQARKSTKLFNNNRVRIILDECHPQYHQNQYCSHSFQLSDQNKRILLVSWSEKWYTRPDMLTLENLFDIQAVKETWLAVVDHFPSFVQPATHSAQLSRRTRF